jgi:hypothetical protein
MVSFDLSTTNIILTVAVVALFTFFVVLLMKLNPSAEKEENFETQIGVDRQKPLQTSHFAPQNPQPNRVDPPRIEVPRTVEKPLAVSATIGGGSVQTKQVTPPPIPPLRESRETPRSPEKNGAQMKTEAFPSRKDCIHHFGYLRTFPKNSPIPDECFGCERIVDCLVNNNKRSNGKNERVR